MKYLFPIITLILLVGCKNDSTKNEITDQEDIELEKTVNTLDRKDVDLDLQIKSLNLKRRELTEKKDGKAELESMLISKSYYKEGEWYTMDFKYPYLDEKINPDF